MACPLHKVLCAPSLWAITAFRCRSTQSASRPDVPAEIPFESNEGLLWIKATLAQSAEPLNSFWILAPGQRHKPQHR